MYFFYIEVLYLSTGQSLDVKFIVIYKIATSIINAKSIKSEWKRVRSWSFFKKCIRGEFKNITSIIRTRVCSYGSYPHTKGRRYFPNKTKRRKHRISKGRSRRLSLRVGLGLTGFRSKTFQR